MNENIDPNIQSPYHPQSEPMPPFVPMPPQPGMLMRPRRRLTWRERLFEGTSTIPLTLQQERTLPKWLVGKSVLFFFISLAACTFAFGHPMEMRYAVIASLSVLLFFYGSKSLSSRDATKSELAFLKNVFVVGVVARIVWVVYCYFFFNPDYYGNTFGDRADVEWYMPYGQAIAEWIKGESRMSFSDLMNSWGGHLDDVGYPIWLAILSILSFGESDVFVPFVVKCLIGAYCAICIYRVTKRHFGDGTARLAALFVALNPNMIYWCASMMKETEMVFLCCLSIDLVDKTFTSGSKLTFKSLFPGVLAGMAVFFFRAPLAIVLFLAMGAHIVMASNKVMSAGKKVIAGVMVGVVLLVAMGDRLRMQAEEIVESVQNNESRQRQNVEWRAQRKGGNTFAKYAGTAVFAPLIFTIPFPTINAASEEQYFLQQMSGGYYIKNIFSFFVLWVMITFLLSGEWRRHVFILAYTLGYLVTLVLSNFAQSGRFHMPIWPMMMLFAAYGIQIAKTNPKMKRWFSIVLVAEVAVCLAWNWFKLAGRGMI